MLQNVVGKDKKKLMLRLIRAKFAKVLISFHSEARGRKLPINAMRCKGRY
jgi:hypothetical protein